MIEIRKVTIPELSDEQRNLYVYLPAAARREPQRRFPVLYMFDGHNVFYDSHSTYGRSWRLGDYLDRTDTPLIVAAIECSHLPNARISEYAPFSFRDSEFGQVTGRGRETMEWIVNVMKPLVDSSYPTLPDRANTFIAGSSMGGLMSLYALCAYNAVFSRCAALSPSIIFGEKALDACLRNAALSDGAVVYMDYGEQELGFADTAARWRSVSSLLLRKNVQLTARIVPGGTHCEASWERQEPFFIPTLLYGLTL